MSAQTVRQQARRTALDAHTRLRIKRAEQDKRRSVLAVTVVQALAERDATVAACERRAGEALRTLTQDEGLTLREAVSWCGDELSTREATRLRRLAPYVAASDPVGSKRASHPETKTETIDKDSGGDGLAASVLAWSEPPRMAARKQLSDSALGDPRGSGQARQGTA